MKTVKKIFISLTAVVLLFSLALNASAKADEGCGWFIKRNGNKQPSIPAEAEYIQNYGGYYIDTKHGDECSEKKLYITFDIGYENGNTARILDTLKEKDVPAAFFVLDNVILKDTELVVRMTEEGHLVCNHTKNHRDITKCTDEEIIKNITDLEKIYTQKTGRELARYFRFPEGKYSEAALKCVYSLGYKTIFWSFAYADWDNGRQPSCDAAMKKILSNTHNGAVILLHPTSKTNADILPELIDKWRQMGYSFGTLDELTEE